MKALVKSYHRITEKQPPVLEAVSDDPLPSFFFFYALGQREVSFS